MYFKDRRSESTLSADPGSVLPPDSGHDHQDHVGDRLYRAVRAVVSPFYRVGCRVRTEGLDNVPMDEAHAVVDRLCRQRVTELAGGGRGRSRRCVRRRRRRANR